MRVVHVPIGVVWRNGASREEIEIIVPRSCMAENRDVSGNQSEMSRCADCPARDVGFCSRLPQPLRDRFREAVRPSGSDRLKGEEGIPLTGWDVAVVARGTLAVKNTFEDGRRAISDLLFPGELIHFDSGGTRRGRHITTSSDFQVCLVPQLDAAFEPDDCHCLERFVRTDAIAHIEELREMIAALARLGPKERLAHLLLGLRERLNSEGKTIRLPLSRNDIADVIGIRVETVSRAFLELERTGLIRRRGPKTIDILDVDTLAQVAAG